MESQTFPEPSGRQATETSAGAVASLRKRATPNTDDLLLSIILCLPLAALYIYGCQHSVGSGDMTELIIASSTLGIPHPTGYPVYTWLGKLFSSLRIGGIPFRISLMSATFAFLALLIVFLFVVRAARRVHGYSRIVYLFGSLAVTLLGLTHPFWHHARVAEVYSLNTFFVLLLAYLYAAWLETDRVRYLYGSSLALGICLGTHLSNVLIVPVFVVMTWRTSRQGRYVLRSVLLIIGGALQYIYLLMRAYQSPPYLHPQARFFDRLSWTGTDNPIHNWLWFITGGRWRGYYIESADRALFKLHELRRMLIADYTTVGVGLLLVGLALYIALQDRRRKTCFVPILMLLQFIYFLGYEMSAPGMILPLFAFAAIFIALGVSSISNLLGRLPAPPRLRTYASYGFAAVIGVWLVHASVSRPPLDLSHLDVPELWISKAIDSLPRGSTLDGVVWKYEKIIDYYRIVRGREIPFRCTECDDMSIHHGRCFVLGTPEMTIKYRNIGYSLTPYAFIGGEVVVYQVHARE
jgi:hypothetical protein